MLKRLRSLRFRITLFATLAVTAALVAAGVGLVLTVERTLLGRLRSAAIDRVEAVADAVAAGRDPDVDTGEPPETLVQVLDEDGVVVDTVPRDAFIRFGGTFERPVTDPLASRQQATIIQRAPAEGATVIRQLDAEELILAQKTVDSPDGTRTVVAVSPFSGVARSIDSVVTALWVGTPFLIAFVAWVSWNLTGRTLKPVDQIRRRADEISHSTLGERLPSPGTDDEIDRLAVTLNSMLARLEDSARRQREFVSDASHELRSPIAAIRAQLEVALAHPEQGSWAKVAGDSLAETDRLERLVGDLLALARAEELSPRVERVDVSDVVQEQIERNRDPRVRVETRPGIVEGDRDQLDRAVANLLDNARRHARERIDVTIAEDTGAVLLSVEDDGAGIPQGSRERVFERFTRLEDGRTRNDGGVGIGLALVARVADNHRGSVRCVESALGGARIELRLPKAIGP